MNGKGARNPTRPGPRLGTLLRGEMAEAYEKRGHGRSDLVLHYSGKAKKDVGLTGELEYLHFLHAECDPDVVTVDYSPLNANIDLVGRPHASLVHAVVKTRAGEVVWRRFVQEMPADNSVVKDLDTLIGKGPIAHVSRLEVWSKDQLIANPMSVRNALRALGWIAAARFWPLAEQKTTVLKLLKKNRMATFEEIFSLGVDAGRALFGAAVLELAHSGAVLSDMDLSPLHAMTLFRSVGP